MTQMDRIAVLLCSFVLFHIFTNQKRNKDSYGKAYYFVDIESGVIGR